jgi:hypothetical protein
MVNDVQCAVAYIRNLCFYSTDINFTLPAARDLWEAPDPENWRTMYLAERRTGPGGVPSLLEAVQNPSILQAESSEYDGELALFAVLHCLWSQQAAYMDAKILNQGNRSSTKSRQGALWLEGQRQDLYRRLVDQRDLLRSMTPHMVEAELLCELFMMNLFASPTDIQKLAGRFGVKESRWTMPNLKAWAESDEPRYAMWHAGQSLRAAQRMAPTRLHGFYAIAVHQACLILASPFLLKAFGRASPTTMSPESHAAISSFPHSDNSTSGRPTNIVLLNGPETSQTKSYLLTGNGTPALMIENKVKALSCIDIIPQVLESIFRKNHSAPVDHLPPLLEQLIVLVSDLAWLAGRAE